MQALGIEDGDREEARQQGAAGQDLARRGDGSPRDSLAEVAIEVRGLSLRYRQGLLRPRSKQALVDVSFEARRGELVGVVGPNGSGKSSLFRSLLGLEAATGEARILGRSPGHGSLRRRIGSSSDEGLPFPEFTAQELLTLHGTLSGLALAEARRRSTELLERVGLQDAARRRHGEFSSGMSKRLALAQALLHEPELLLLDEPTANLDPLGIQLVADELRAFQAGGGCALIATHGLEDFEGLFDRFLVLLEGRRVAFGTPDEVLGEARRHELQLEAEDPLVLEELRRLAESREIRITRSGPLHRSLGRLLADVQSERSDASRGDRS
jgi:ABC-2 type transport system ATP-binding protein